MKHWHSAIQTAPFPFALGCNLPRKIENSKEALLALLSGGLRVSSRLGAVAPASMFHGHLGQSQQSQHSRIEMTTHMPLHQTNLSITRELATAAIKCRLMVHLSVASWRGWADLLLGSVQSVHMSARQDRARTQHGGHRDGSQIGVDNSYNLRMHNAAVCTALALHTYPVGRW